MRKSATLEALFPGSRRRVLVTALTQPGKWWFLSEMADFLGTTPSSLQRELASLVNVGILEQRRDGVRTYFRAQKKSPIYRELRGIIEKTAGIVPTLQELLRPLDEKVTFAFIYGSIARAQEHAASDIDLMVVGQAGLADLTPVLRKAERILGREVNATTFSHREFSNKVAAGDHFLAAVLKQPRQFVKGNERELGKLTGQ